MENLAPIYKIRKGSIHHDELVLPFIFGLVYLEEGQYLFELFFDENYPLEEVYNNNKRIIFNESLTITSCLVNGDSLIAIDVATISIEDGYNKMKLECFGKITIEKPIKDFERVDLKDSIRESNLHFLKLEGLRMQFSNHTEVEAWRNNSKIISQELGNYYFDHSVCELQVGWDSYKTIWSEDDGEVIVQFLHPEAQYQSMPFSKYEEIKSDFISIVSFLNGAPVRIRGEYTGAYYSVLKIDSQVKHLYSFKNESNKRHNQFIPLNDTWFQHDNILSRVLMWDFNRYRYWNQKLNLNSIIYMLGNAEQVRSVSERVFIQMILLERLSDSYALITPNQNHSLIDVNIFSEIKPDLEGVLLKLKGRISDTHFDTIKGRVFGANDGKRQRTDVKINALLEGVGIEITEGIRDVIGKDRHSIIHKGDIGSGEAFQVLDNLLRQVIVNLIKYNGPTKDTPQGGQVGRPIWESPDEYLIK